ncbi:hypothetical protein FJZ26_03685 [Candidatus Parvarchaeota archaeon]|nr:hypothetical protein [Candidatus Parvarchaeota archaeon]
MEGSFSVSAPSKLILCGEHFVVYGAPAIAMPLELRHTVKASQIAGGVEVSGILGCFDFSSPREKIPQQAALYFASYEKACEKIGRKLNGVRFDISKNIYGKGLGSSSAVAAALAAACFEAAGFPYAPQDVFECAQAADLATTSGKASGIDARTVSIGIAQEFQRFFNPDKFAFSQISIRLPKDSFLLVVDTFAGKRSTTKEQVEKFAACVGAAAPPSQLPQAQRDKINADYTSLYPRLKAQLLSASPDGRQLGKLFLENHKLLTSRSVSTREIDLAVKTAVSCGAWGAKLTAAGGDGGSVIVIGPRDNLRKVESGIERMGFKPFEAPAATQGIKVQREK